MLTPLKNPLGEVLRRQREEMGLGVREVCRLTEKSTSSGRSVSPSYYSQVENGIGLRPEKVSIDFMWAVGAVLKIDPLELFVLSRPNVPNDYLDKERRRKLFS